MKAWLTVENNGECARIEAWLSGPGVGPDFTGNAWRGWKTALPHTRFGFGPQFIFRKQFYTLLDLLKSKTQSEIQEKTFQQAPALDKSMLAKGLAFFGFVLLIMGVINLLSATSLLLKSAFPDLANTILINGVSGVVIGGLIFASSRALAKGKIIAIWFYVGSIVVDCIYNFTTGRPINYSFIGFGLLFIWQMFRFKDEWQLS